jgi:hypothetical protein
MMNPRVLALCAVVVLAACHRDSSQTPAAKPAPEVHKAVAAQRAPASGELTAGMVEATSQGKGQAPVALKFDLLQRPTMGQPLEIAIALAPRIPASPAIVEVTGSDGLKLAAGDGHIEFPAVEAGQVYRHSIKVTPTVEGVLLMTLSVSLKHDEITDSRVFSLPLIVGANSTADTSQTGAASPAPPAGASSSAGTASADTQKR